MRSTSPRVSVVIPTWNEARNLPAVLEGIAPFAAEVFVVDRHSEDGTREVAARFGATFLLDDRKGKGAALRLGASKATGDILLFLDADHSHDPNDIPRLLAPILAGDADHVSGSRMLGGSEELFSSLGELVRLFGNLVITWVIGTRYGVRLTDLQNGFRCMRRSLYTELPLTENSMTIEMQMVVETLRRGYRLLEVPAHEYRRHAGKSTLSVWRAAPRFGWYLFSCLFRRKLRKTPAGIVDIQEKYRPRWAVKISSRAAAR